jgi:triphosphatase
VATDPVAPNIERKDMEIEWQFDALDLRPVERWLAALPLRPPGLENLPTLTAQAKPVRRLVDHYLDTEDWRIGRAGFVLRVRQRGRHEEATLKDRGSADASGLRRRLEVTETLAASGIDSLSQDGPVGRRVHAVAGRRALRPVLEVRTRRRPFSLRAGGIEVAEVALDDTLISLGVGQRPVQLRRVEVELSPSADGELTRLMEELRTTCGLQPASLSKFEAGLLAMGVSISAIPDLGPNDIGPESTLGELAFGVLRRQVGVLYATEPGTRLGEDLEELHDMRVASRRLRGALDLFAEVLPIRARTLRSELGWLAEVLGSVRDLDVQLERMNDQSHFGVHRPGEGSFAPSLMDGLRTLLQEEREAARHAMILALDSPRYERLLNGLSQMVRQGPSRYARITRVPAATAAPPLVAKPHVAALKAAKRAQRSGIATDFHRLRIRCKRLRYALEFTADLYGNRTETFTKRLARLQDKLGLMQDAEVATARLWQLVTERNDVLSPETVFAMGSVAERYRVEAAELLDKMPKQLSVLSGKEWRELNELMEKRRRDTMSRAEQPLPRVAPTPPTTTSPTPSTVAPVSSVDDVLVGDPIVAPISPVSPLHIASTGITVEAGTTRPETAAPTETVGSFESPGAEGTAPPEEVRGADEAPPPGERSVFAPLEVSETEQRLEGPNMRAEEIAQPNGHLHGT